MKKIPVFLVLAILLVLIAVLGKYFLITHSLDLDSNSGQPLAVCTLEARVCADGTTVGRSGLACEFEACPEVPVENETPTSTATSTILVNTNSKSVPDSAFSDVVNRTYTKNNISITPLEVIEDSRCPLGVMCIQAGTVRLKVKLQTGFIKNEATLTLGKSFMFSGQEITLLAVEPIARRSDSLETRNYTFNFTVTNPSAISGQGGTLSGVMTIGPVCPIEQIDNPCLPTAEMFASHKIAVFKEEQKVLTLVTTLTPDRNGQFSTELLVGNYLVKLEKSLPGPGGAKDLPKTISITKGVTTNITVDIDTGIR